MKTGLAHAPAFMPKLRLQGLRFLGRIRTVFIGCGCRFIWNPVLFIEPRAQIDEPAAIAAKGPINRFRRPFDRALAGRTFDDCCHRNLCPDSSAARQKKRHIHFDVYRTTGGIKPIQKSNGATMLATADLGIQSAVGRQGHAHQLARILAIKL
jgi:hypothetical protein